MKLSNFCQNKIVLFLGVFFAIALQIQLSFFQSANYVGLRINLAAIILPIIAAFLCLAWLTKKIPFPEFHLKKLKIWFILLSAVFIYGLGRSYFLYHELSNWALINKTLGWFVLCWYFVIGGWMASCMSGKQLNIFIKSALGFLVFIIIVEIIRYTYIQYTQTFEVYHFVPPLEGLMGNKNSYIFLLFSLLGFSAFFSQNNNKYLTWINYSLWFFIPLLIVYSGTRTGIIVFICLIPLLFILKVAPIRKAFMKMCILLVGILSVILINNTSHYEIRFLHYKNAEMAALKQAEEILKTDEFSSVERKISHHGDSLRIKILNTTFSMIKEHPILGSGLGSAKYAQEKQWGEFINIIDNTTLWLWAETGIFGLLIFLGFYFSCLKTLYKNGFNKDNSDLAQKLNKSVLLMLIIFAIMSLFHELLYTRFLWFFMGLALAYPLKNPTPAEHHQT